MHPDWTGEDMEGVIANRVFFSLALLYFIPPVHFQNVIYREGASFDSRRFVSLGGLFNFRRSKDGQCDALRAPTAERAEAMVFAIHKINSDRSLLPGVNLTFDIRDTCYVSNIALERSLDFVQSSEASCTNQTTLAVSGVVGSSRSSVSAAVASLFRLFQLPQISYGSTAALLSDKSNFDYFFRTIPSDAFQARAMADLIVHFNWTFVFALFSQDTYGREGIDLLIEALTAQNDSQRCVAMKIALPLGLSDNRTYDRVVERMSQEWVQNASVAVLFGHRSEAIDLIRAIMRTTDVTTSKFFEKITWIASDGWSLNLPVEYRKKAKGMLGLQPHPGSREDFKRHFVSLNPKNNKTDNPWFNSYWETVFNCSLQENNPCNTSAQNLSETTRAVYTAYVIDAVYAFAYAIHQMIVDHCLTDTICDAIVMRRSTGEAIDGALLRQYLFNVSFNSTFSEMPGERLFDTYGDVQGSYLIVNLQLTNDQLQFETVGTWDHINLLQLFGPVQWPGDREDPPQSVCSLPCGVGHQPHRLSDQAQCCWECKPCLGENTASSDEECYECDEMYMPNIEKSACIAIPLTFFTPPSPWAVIILLLTCAGIAATIFVAVMFVIFHKKKVIKASSRELSAILLGGILLCYILPFLFVGKPSPALCGVRRFAIGFCFAISYSALLVRSNRIHRIFNHSHVSSISPRFIGPVSQVVITCLLISIQVLIAVVWLAAEPPSVETVQPNSRTLELRCAESPYFGLPVSLFYNLFLLVLSTYFAFLTRKVPDNFNEAKFINVTVYSLCIIWLWFLPAYFVSIQFGTVYESFFLLLAIILSASATLLCLLAPKIFIVILNKGEEKKDGTTGTGTGITAISIQATST